MMRAIICKIKGLVSLITNYPPREIIYNNCIWKYDIDKTDGNEYLPKALWESAPIDDLSKMAQTGFLLGGIDAGVSWSKKTTANATIRLEDDGVYLDFELLDDFAIERLKKPKCTLYMKQDWINTVFNEYFTKEEIIRGEGFNK